MFTKLLLLCGICFFVLNSSIINAQKSRFCGFDELAIHDLDLMDIDNTANPNPAIRAPITIEVVFHVVYKNGSRFITDEIIIEQLSILNQGLYLLQIHQDGKNTLSTKLVVQK